MPLPDGAALVDFCSPEQLEGFEKSVKENGDGWRLPLPALEELDDGKNLVDLTAADLALIEKLAPPQPFDAARQRASLKNPRRKDLPKLAVWCEDSSAVIREFLQNAPPLFDELRDEKFDFVDLPTGHYPMFTRPAELAEIIIKAAEK